MYNLQQHAGANVCLGNFTLTGLSGAATTHSHTASLPIAIGGVFGTSPSGTATPTVNSAPSAPTAIVAAVAGAALASAAPASGFRAALVVWTVDAAGTKRIRSTGWHESLSGAELSLPFPTIPSTEVAVAYHTIKAGTTVSGTWTFGSSNWNSTGITVGTVVNLFGLPQIGAVQVS
jgi:hypothetical protein